MDEESSRHVYHKSHSIQERILKSSEKPQWLPGMVLNTGVQFGQSIGFIFPPFFISALRF